MKLLFINEEHEKFFWDNINHNKKDEYLAALVYALGIDITTRENFDAIYDRKGHLIKLECLKDKWQTNLSKDLTKFAFYLWNGRKYNLDSIIKSNLLEYSVQAFFILYERYDLEINIKH